VGGWGGAWGGDVAPSPVFGMEYGAWLPKNLLTSWLTTVHFGTFKKYLKKANKFL